MLHLLPDYYKRFYIFQMIVLLSFIVVGSITFPIILAAYLVLFRSNRMLYRAAVNRLCYFVWIHFTYIAQWWNGLRIRLFADKESLSHIGKEHALIIMNHKYDIDWVTTWIFAEKYGVLGGGQSFAKNSLKHVPIIGWIWQFNGTIFLNRDYERDKEIIRNSLQNFHESLDDYYHVLLLYPEGTRFTEKKLKASNEIARSKGMPELKHCLFPRTRGFIDVINNLRTKVDAIYNLTVAFPDSVNPSVKEVNTSQPSFTMLNVLSAKVKEGNIAFERLSMKDLPHTDEDLAAYLHELFRKKDDIFDKYVNTGTFEGPHITIQPPLIGLVINCITFVLIWTILGNWLFRVLWHNTWLIRSIILGIILTLCLMIQLIMNITKTEKGSSYGTKVKTH